MALAHCGLLQSRLQQILPFSAAAVCVGVLWAAWHLPLFLFRGWSSAPPAVFVLIMIGLSLVMAFAFNVSGGSVAVAILMHSAFNASPRFLEGYLNSVPTRDYPSAKSSSLLPFCWWERR
jgi:membrane protease YdiL (CAAX protease family)